MSDFRPILTVELLQYCVDCGTPRWVMLREGKPNSIRCRPCGKINGKRKPTIDRFWPKVNKTETCWFWTGAADSKWGYGSLYHEDRVHLAHRVSWMLFRGPIPEGMDVCHKCDTPPCVNPDHLFIGTRLDNMRDCSFKGRHFLQKNPSRARRGEQCHKSKFITGEVIAIRAIYAHGGIGLTRLSRAYGISKSAMHSIVTRKSWAHV